MKINIKFLIFMVLLFILAIIINTLWVSKTCSYCFQNKITKDYLLGYNYNFSSVYIDNTIANIKHNTSNLFGGFISNIFKNQYNSLFWILFSLISIFILIYSIFNRLEVGLFASFVYLTNTTLFVTIHHIFYYFLSIFSFYYFIRKKKVIYLFLIIIFLLMAVNTDVSAAFSIFITIISLAIFYIFLKLFSKEVNKIDFIWLFILFLLTLILGFIFEKNFLIDLIRRLPLFFNKFIFYIISYPKSLYFYLFLIAKLLLLIFPIIYFLKNIRRFKEFNIKERFILSYILTAVPLLILFISFDVFARIFDYFNVLLAAITFEHSKIFGGKKRNIFLVILIIFFTFFSIFTHYIPPRSLEVYNEEFILGLEQIPRNPIIYTDSFVANFLIDNMNIITVNGADFNQGEEEYYNIYYNKAPFYIKKFFLMKNIDYFVISRQSTERGLDLLNAPHFLKPLTNIEEYDKIEFLEKYYENRELTIWRFKK